MKMKPKLIQAHQLSRIYHLGDTQVVGLERIDLAVDEGELLVIKGDSGSGKSTLLSLLAGLDTPSSGALMVAGHDLARSSAASLTLFRRQVVGMVFQAFNLLPTLNVLENICLPALLARTPFAAARDKARRLAERFHLARRLAHRPHQLSGGEMQRTAIARALINDPAIILADEPTGNLDSENGGNVISLLAALNRDLGTTILIATHSTIADTVALRQIHLRDGRIKEAPWAP
jgi:putative ABC transport system ATP-binding protein